MRHSFVCKVNSLQDLQVSFGCFTEMIEANRFRPEQIENIITLTHKRFEDHVCSTFLQGKVKKRNRNSDGVEAVENSSEVAR